MNNLNNTDSLTEGYKSIIHIDRLEITFRHSIFSTFRNIRNPDTIPEKQLYGHIELILDNRCGSSAYYHTFCVYYKGYKVGKLHTGSKRGKTDIEFNFEKRVLYSNKRDYWYEIYQAIGSELILAYNNIKYIEICLDSTKCFTDEYGYLYANSVDNKYRFNDYFKPIRNVKPEVLDGGNEFRIGGSSNSIQVYNKSNHSEDFIQDFFNTNGFIDKTVYRIESKLKWNYIKSLINQKHILISPEILLDDKMLVTLFDLSVKNKLSFYDLRTKNYDHQRNVRYDRISILDDIDLRKTELLKYNPAIQANHYNTENTDEDIVRKTYYQFIRTGSAKYFINIRNSAEAAQMDDLDVIALLHKFNHRFKGDLTSDVLKRMDYAIRNYLPKKKGNAISRFIDKFVIWCK